MKRPIRGWLCKSGEGKGWNFYLPVASARQKAEKRLTVTALFGGTNRPSTLKVIPAATPPDDDGFPAQIRMATNKTVKVGPFIGILTTRSGKRILGNMANFRELLQTARELGGVGFVFTPEDIDWSSREVVGIHYCPERRKWKRDVFPIPDVVYNRIPNRRSERHPRIRNTLGRLQEFPGVHLFNPRFFDKWELHQILKKTPLKRYLPETRLLAGISGLKEMLERHGDLYLKPAEGKAGIGIMRLVADGGTIRLHLNREEKGKSLSFADTGGLWQELQNRIRQSRYLIQQAIPLLTYNGTPWDIRLLVQKNRRGQWDVSGIGIRVAGEHAITTHVPQGGYIVRPEEALAPHFGPDGTKNLLKQVKKVSVQIATALEAHYRHLGEISMDLGITREGRIWFFEANAKPMKFDEPDIRKVSLQRIIQYCHYLFFNPPK